MPKDDAIRFRHMLESALEALEFTRPHHRSDLDQDRLLLLGLLKLIEILGEAAARIRPETRNRYPQIPWMDIIDMRNRVVHVYFDIDRDEVWDTVTKDLPPLIEQLEIILKNEPKGP